MLNIAGEDTKILHFQIIKSGKSLVVTDEITTFTLYRNGLSVGPGTKSNLIDNIWCDQVPGRQLVPCFE